MIAGAIGAASSVIGGVQANRAAKFQAQQAQVNAGQARAGSQRNAQEQLRKSRLVSSRALAVAAASGAGASDRTVTDIISGIAGEGTYRSMLALYEGDDKARSLETQADSLRYSGRAEQTAGFLKGATSLFSIYGQGGPKGGGGLNDEWYSSSMRDYGLPSDDPAYG